MKHKNGTTNPERNTWKDRIEIFSWIATVGVFIFSICVACRQESMFHTDERAWVSADAFNVYTNTYSAQTAIQFRVVVKNTGKTPAFIDETEYSIGVSAPPSTNIEWSFPNKSRGVNVSPGGSAVIGLIEPAPLGDSDFRKLEARQIIHHFRVAIYYHDAFDGRHKTTFGVFFCGPVENLSSLIAIEDPGIME